VDENAPVEVLEVVVGDVARQLKPQIESKQIKLNTELSLGLSIQAGQEEARFAISSLLENAVKFSPEGGIVNIRTLVSRNGAEITISDAGPGIPADKLNELFQPFNRSTSAQTYNYEGMGMGLYTNKMLIEKLGGTLSISNNKTTGITARVVLPKPKASGGLAGSLITPTTA
jgi:signal transduction histidine kinase